MSGCDCGLTVVGPIDDASGRGQVAANEAAQPLKGMPRLAPANQPSAPSASSPRLIPSPTSWSASALPSDWQVGGSPASAKASSSPASALPGRAAWADGPTRGTRTPVAPSTDGRAEKGGVEGKGEGG